MDKEAFVFFSQIGGAFGGTLFIFYFAWEVFSKITSSKGTSHEDIAMSMAACENRITSHFSELKREVELFQKPLYKTSNDIQWIRSLLEKTDDDGSPVIYNKKSIEKAILSAAVSADQTNRLLAELLSEIRKNGAHR